jgi:hypothetical protein
VLAAERLWETLGPYTQSQELIVSKPGFKVKQLMYVTHSFFPAALGLGCLWVLWIEVPAEPFLVLFYPSLPLEEKKEKCCQ